MWCQTATAAALHMGPSWVSSCARLLRQLLCSTWVLRTGFLSWVLLSPDCYGSCCASPGIFTWASSSCACVRGIPSCARLLRQLQHGRLLRQLQHMLFIFSPASVQHAHPRVACAFCRCLTAGLKAAAYLGYWVRHKISHARWRRSYRRRCEAGVNARRRQTILLCIRMRVAFTI